MKVIAIIGSYRKNGQTSNACLRFLENLNMHADIEWEIIHISDYNIKICLGCKRCFNKGEELCPLSDDRDIIISKMKEADGVIFASPNYAFQVSGFMKVLLDRLAFTFHRPSFFGKTFTNIVPQGIYGGNKIVQYLDFIGNAMGFNIVKGICIRTLEPVANSSQIKNEKIIHVQSQRFLKELVKNRVKTPSLLEVLLFRFSRSSIKKNLNENYRDYSYYNENNWFVSQYFYPIKLNPVKLLAGSLIDFIASKPAK